MHCDVFVKVCPVFLKTTVVFGFVCTTLYLSARPISLRDPFCELPAPSTAQPKPAGTWLWPTVRARPQLCFSTRPGPCHPHLILQEELGSRLRGGGLALSDGALCVFALMRLRFCRFVFRSCLESIHVITTWFLRKFMLNPLPTPAS